jgi:hypothetical protein
MDDGYNLRPASGRDRRRLRSKTLTKARRNGYCASDVRLEQ